MKNAVLILFLFVNIAFGQKNNSIEKGFALVQSRQETTEFNALKGKKVIPVLFSTTKPLYPIKKHGQSRGVNSNAVYIQDNTSLRVFVFTNGIPKNFDLKTFIPPALATNKPISQVKEEKDIVFEVDFEKKNFSIIQPNNVQRLLNYHSRTIGGVSLVEFEMATYYLDNTKFKYLTCNEGFYDIDVMKGQISNSARVASISGSALATPRININGEYKSNDYLKQQNQSITATDFRIQTMNSILKIDNEGHLDLEKSWDANNPNNEKCNQVSYVYNPDGKRYKIIFRYVRRDLDSLTGKIECTPGERCGTKYLEDIILPPTPSEYNLRTNPNATLPQIVDLMIICVPDESDSAGKPKPE